MSIRIFAHSHFIEDLSLHALSRGRVPGFLRLSSLGSGAVDGGGANGLTPRTAVGEVKEFLHMGSPFLVDLGVVGVGQKLDQSLGGDEGVVTGLRVVREESAGLALGALLTLASIGTIALFTDSGILAVLLPVLFSTAPSSPLRIWPPAPSGAQESATTNIH